MTHAHDEDENELAALPAPVAAVGPAVGIKPLEWERTRTSSARAKCPVWVWADVYLWNDRWDWRLGNSTCTARCETIEQAIAEVEEERQSRIRSALIPAEPAVEVVEALWPFAEESKRWQGEPSWPDDYQPASVFTLNLGDFRRASKALTTLQAPATPDAQEDR